MEPLIDLEKLNINLLSSNNKVKNVAGILLRVWRQSVVDFTPGADRGAFERAMRREDTKVERVKDRRDNLPQ